MSYRKFSADYLFDGHRLLGKDQVLITDEAGMIHQVCGIEDAGEGIEFLPGLISPGFINCHCHLELSHLRGLIPRKTGLVDFVFAVVSRRRTGPDQIREAIANAELEMISEGIVAVGDICNTADTIPLKSAARLDYYNFIESIGWLPSQARERFTESRNLYNHFIVAGADPDRLALVPHAPYSVSKELWACLKPGFAGKTITIHNQETAAEDEFFTAATGQLTRMYEMMKIDNSWFNPTGSGSLDFYLDELKGAAKIILVHNTCSTPADLQRMKEMGPGLFCCLCPNANEYIEGRLPDIAAMEKLDMPIVIGTDSLASNSRLSVLEELKTIRKNQPHIAIERLLTWATSNGARALQMEHSLGDFTKGKKPGIVLIGSPGQDLLGPESRCRRLL
ncbi:MAG TPA: amidohydrolase family protein [Puia sp.]|nr:amidohydrolase family protein [Puia sp.]